MYSILFLDIGVTVKRTKTDPSGNEIVVQDVKPEDDPQTKFYTQHMKRHLPPTMADRPTARAFDEHLSKQVSYSFAEQKFASEDYSPKDSEIASNYGKTLWIMSGCLLILIAVVGIINHNDNKQFEKLIQENKAKKSA